MSTETIEFQAEARQLLQLMIHAIYSSKDVFLRELISNSSDALDKLRLAAFRDKDLDVDTDDLHITVSTDAATRTLTVADNGIGMSRDEVVDLIGTIAKSGTNEVLAKLRQARETGQSEQASAELIGQFGVGFYSSFMVADKVTLVTRKAGSHQGVRWESTGEGSYTVSDEPDAPQGTSVTLHLKPEDTEDELHDYSSPMTVRGHHQALLRLHHLADSHAAGRPACGGGGKRGREHGRGGSGTRDRQLPQGAVGPAAERGVRRGVHRVLPARQPRLAGAAADHPALRRGHLRVPGTAVHPRSCADGPVSGATPSAACSCTSSGSSSWTTARSWSPSTCASSRGSSTRTTCPSTSRGRSCSRTGRSG